MSVPEPLPRDMLASDQWAWSDGPGVQTGSNLFFLLPLPLWSQKLPERVWGPVRFWEKRRAGRSPNLWGEPCTVVRDKLPLESTTQTSLLYEDLSPHQTLAKAHRESVRDGVRGALPEAHWADADVTSVFPGHSVLCPWVGWVLSTGPESKKQGEVSCRDIAQSRARPRAQGTRGTWARAEETARRGTRWSGSRQLFALGR